MKSRASCYDVEKNTSIILPKIHNLNSWGNIRHPKTEEHFTKSVLFKSIMVMNVKEIEDLGRVKVTGETPTQAVVTLYWNSEQKKLH